MLATILSTGRISVNYPFAFCVSCSSDRLSFDSSLTYRANLVLASVLGTSSIGIGYPFAIGVSSGGDGFCFYGCRAYGANLVLATVLGTGRISINYPFAFCVSCSSDRLSFDGSLAYRANLVLATVLGTSSIGIGYPFAIGVARSINALSLPFAASARAFLFSIFGASCFICGFPFAEAVSCGVNIIANIRITAGASICGVSFCSTSGGGNSGIIYVANRDDRLRFNLSASACTTFFALFGTSRLSSNGPLTPFVNVGLGLIVARVRSFARTGFISGRCAIVGSGCFCRCVVSIKT